MSNQYDKIYNHPTLNIAINSMTKLYISEKYSIDNFTIEEYDLRKAGWLASILAESKDEYHKYKAQVFASLLYVLHSKDIASNQLSYVIFSRIGNLLATKFLKKLYNLDNENIDSYIFKHSFGTILDYEIVAKRYENTINIGKETILSTDFQNELWQELNKKENISISAPTSSGKSFIIQAFINKEFQSNEEFNVLYIVPTKALLNQVSDDFRKLLDDKIEIKTAYIEKQFDDSIENYNKIKKIYILTPERCLLLLQKDVILKFRPNIIFVDEIQNIEDEHGRGILMEYVLGEITRAWPRTKIIVAGPFIKNSRKLFNSIFNKNSNDLETSLSPVFQFKSIVRPSIYENNIKMLIKPLDNRNKSIQVSIPSEVNFKKIINNIGMTMAEVVKVLGKTGQSIIYAPTSYLAEGWALKYCENINCKSEIKELNDLIEFLREEIHPQYYLIKCLKVGVAFHHSKLPDIVRKEIELQFKQGNIKFLYCTSTLLQGVNLPANQLFIPSPKKKNIDLSAFEFGNLIGRAGRINDALFGMIYCVEGLSEEKEWADEYYNEAYEKEVITAAQSAFANIDEIVNDINKSFNDIKDEKVANAISLLRHKYLQGSNELNKFLEAKDVDYAIIKHIKNECQRNLKGISLESDILKLNPSIDPLLQEELLQKIKSEGIRKWVLIPNSNFYKKFTRENMLNIRYENLSFYWQLAKLCEKLDKIFNIREEAYKKNNISLTVNSMAYFAFRWMQNRSLREIIEDDIEFQADKLGAINRNDDKAINRVINRIVNIHSKIVTFLLVKYFKLLTDIIECILTEEEKEKYKFTLALPIMMELGTTDPIVIQLISGGMTRSVALIVSKEFKKDKNNNGNDVFLWLKENGNDLNIRAIYLNYLKNKKFI